MKQAFATVVLLSALSVALVSCGGSSSNPPSTSGLKFRAFITNPLFPLQTGGGAPVIDIMDASKDVLSFFRVDLSSSVLNPGMMAVSPNKKLTLVFGANNNVVSIIDNATERPASNAAGSATLPSVALGGATESMFVWIDNLTAFAAVPTAPVPITGGTPGLVQRVDLSTGRISASIPIPGAHFVVESHNGNHILALSDSLGEVTVIAPSLIGTTQNALTPIQCGSPAITNCFDHPAWAVFSADDATAYIFECGPECGGTLAKITAVDLTTNTITTSVPVDAATFGLANGNTLYVAGTPPTPPGGNTCAGSTTAATSCGRLDIVDLPTLTVTGSAIITDGYHNRMELGSNGRIFVGARNCTNIVTPAGTNGEVRGCLSIFNANTAAVVIPPDNGDVTGIAPITGRNVVYVCENGALRIYDTTTDKLLAFPINTQPPTVLGQAVDVKLVDPGPPS